MPSTITAYNTFQSKTLIRSSEVNANFSNHRGNVIPIASDTATASDNTLNLGTDEYQWQDLFLGNKMHFQGLATTPSLNPTAGSFNFYAKTDGVFYQLNSAGTESSMIGLSDGAVTRDYLAGGAVGTINISSTASTYTMTTTVDLLLATPTTTGQIITMPSLSVSSGRIFKVKKENNNFSTVTINSNAGAEITTLNTFNENVSIVNDASAWHILDRNIPFSTTSYTPGLTNFTGSTVNGRYYREGQYAFINVYVVLNASPSGTMIVDIPSGMTVDYNAFARADYPLEGHANGFDGGVDYLGSIIGNNADNNSIIITGPVAGTVWNATAPFTWVSGDALMLNFKVPITGWKK